MPTPRESADFPHKFETEDACETCGETEDSSLHHQDDVDFHHDFEAPDACLQCALGKDDQQHQTEN